MNANKKNDLFWYTLVGISIVLVLTLLAFYSPQKWTHQYDNWIEFVLLTVVIFGYLLKWYWRSIKSQKFWVLYSILLLTHCLLFGSVFEHLARVPVIWFGVVAALEGSVLIGVVSWLLQRGPHV